MTRASPYRRRPRYVSGIEMPRDLDGRTLRARKFKALIRSYASELGILTEPDKALIAQAAALAVHVESLQADIVAGRDVNEDTAIRLSGELRRMMDVLKGKAVKAKPSGPGLQDYIREKYGEPESTEDSEDAA